MNAYSPITPEMIQEDMRYLQLLSRSFPNIAAASSEIINLEAIVNLPKGTEHFLADLHGEYEAFQHVLRNASGAIKRKVNEIFGNTLRENERKELILKCVSDIENVEVDIYDGLLADYAKQVNACAIIKGLRAMSDFEYEFQMALTNKKLNPDIETLFLTTSAENMYLSSSMVKQIASMGGDIESFVPEVIKQDIINRIK